MIQVSSAHDISLFAIEDGDMEAAKKHACPAFIAAMLRMRGASDIPIWLSEKRPEDMISAIPLSGEEKKAREAFMGLGPGKRVVVYGDYDVDGITATTLAVDLAVQKEASVRYFIPHRFKQGYGFHASVASNIIKSGCDLLIVLDCGTRDIEAINTVSKSGVPVIIFDHHVRGEDLPSCTALVNPHVECADSLLSTLCAAGVLWAWAVRAWVAPINWLRSQLDIVGMATMADCVTLANPLNRAIARCGIEVMRQTPRPGLLSLFNKLDIDPIAVDEEVLAMKVIPCINAAGRLDLAEEAVRLLHPTGDSLELITDKLVRLNLKRRNLSMTIRQEAMAIDERHVYLGENWPVGVLSSVASRMCNERARPIALVAPSGGELRGTLRMPDGGDAVAVLEEISADLSAWGGHKQAAGFSVKRELWEKVGNSLESLLGSVEITQEPVCIMDWPIESFSDALWESTKVLRPFGVGNPHPLFFTGSERKHQVRPMGKTGKVFQVHLGASVMVAFGDTNQLSDLAPCGWVYKPKHEYWRQHRQLRFYLERVVCG